MLNQQLLSLLESALDDYKIYKNEEVAFTCPFCRHYKKKLQINLNTHAWHCWVCNKKGYGIDVLFRLMGENQIKIDKAKEFSPTTRRTQYYNKKTENTILSLPEEYIPLWRNNKEIEKYIEYKHAIRYLKKDRKITDIDILRYRVGFCREGKYKDTIIIPSYDSLGQLNFYVGRSYFSDSYKKHIKPDISNDIIGFELFINWEFPINIVEGVFDAIALRRNTIPLFGKVLTEKLFNKILETRPPIVNVCLDEDAIKDSIVMVDRFLSEGIDVKLIELKDGDVSLKGFNEVIKQINSSSKITHQDLLRFKLLYGVKEKNKKYR